MAAAAKIQSQMNAVGKVLPDLPEGGGEWNTYKPENTNENYKQDENKLPLSELGIHAS